MGENFVSLGQFKNFIRSREKSHNLEEFFPNLTAKLFERLLEKKYKDSSFSEKISEFIDDFGEQLNSEFESRFGISRRTDFISYLLKKRGEKDPCKKERRQEIIDYLELRTSFNNSYDTPQETIHKPDVEFLTIYEKHIIEYEKYLNNLRREGRRGKGRNLIYVLQIIGTFENILGLDYYFHDIESWRGIYYLISPSHVHYLFNPEKTIFIYIRTNLFYGTEIRELLKKHEPKTDKIYLFTLETDPSLHVTSEERADYRVYLVTTNAIKSKGYKNDQSVITLEELLKLCKLKQTNLNYRDLTYVDKQRLKDLFNKKIKSLYECERLKNGYKQQLEKLNESEYKSFKSLEEIINGDWP